MTVDAGALASAPPVNAPPVAWSVAGTCAPCVSFSTQPDSGRAPLLPGLAEASQAPLQTKSRRRARILVGAAASLLAHAALAALVWRTPTPAPQPGLVELTIVYAGDTLQQPAGQTSLELETEPPAALGQELEVQELEVKKTPAPQQESAVLQPPATALVQKAEPAAEPAAGPAAEPAVMASVSQMQTEDKPIRDKPTPSAPALKKPSPPPRAAAQPLGEKSRAEKSRTEGRAAAESRGAQTSALAPPHYLTAVFARVQQAKRYPAKAQARGDQGRAVVSISIRRNGALAEARLVRSSGSSLLDEATLEAMRRAAPFPPLPPDVAGSVLVLSVPMNFTIE